MATPISEYFFGQGASNLLLKKPWSPSGSAVPTNFSEGYVYIAEDAGNVDLGGGAGVEAFVENDSIIYKDGNWIRFGSAAAGGGGGLEPWTPTIVNLPILADDFTVNITLTDNGNGYNMTQTGLADPSAGASGLAASELGITFDGTERGSYFTLTGIGTNTDGNGSTVIFAVTDGDALFGTVPASFAIPYAATNDGADQWTWSNITGGDPSTYVVNNAAMLGSEWGMGFQDTGTNLVAKLYDDGVLVHTWTIALPHNSYTTGATTRIGIAYNPSDGDYMTGTLVETPVADAGFTAVAGADTIDVGDYPATPASKAYIIAGLTDDTPYVSVLGDVYNGSIFAFDDAGTPSTTTVITTNTLDGAGPETITGQWGFELDPDATSDFFHAGTHNPFNTAATEDVAMAVGSFGTGGEKVVLLLSQEDTSTQNTIAQLRVNSDAGSSEKSKIELRVLDAVSGNSTGIEIISDGEGTVRSTSLISGTQTSTMVGGDANQYIATKKYVDDNAYGGILRVFSAGTTTLTDADNGKKVMIDAINGVFTIDVPDTLSVGFTCDVIHIVGGTTTVNLSTSGSMVMVGNTGSVGTSTSRNISVYDTNKAAAT